MKKWLKIWMLTMAFVAAMTAVISTGKVEATWEDTSNIVQVSIDAYNNWNTVCTWTSYYFNDLSASSEVQTGSRTGNITCVFWNRTGTSVTLQLSWDLVHRDDSTLFIPRANVKLKNGTWTDTPTGIVTVSTEASNAVEFHASPVTLVTKTANKIGDASGTNLEISLTIPEWQPNGTYEWTLVLTF